MDNQEKIPNQIAMFLITVLIALILETRIIILLASKVTGDIRYLYLTTFISGLTGGFLLSYFKRKTLALIWLQNLASMVGLILVFTFQLGKYYMFIIIFGYPLLIVSTFIGGLLTYLMQCYWQRFHARILSNNLMLFSAWLFMIIYIKSNLEFYYSCIQPNTNITIESEISDYILNQRVWTDYYSASNSKY